MELRRLRENEIDYELVWLAVSVGFGLCAAAWLKAKLPLPGCFFHDFTGIACPTCGGTRCFRDLIAGHYLTAFLWNPLVFLVLGGVVLYDVYAVVVMLFRLPRVRFSDLPSNTAGALRVIAFATIAANWSYLIVARR